MGKHSNSILKQGKNLFLQSVCMFLLCLGLVAGAAQNVQAAGPPAPVLESVQVVGSDFVLTWSQPESGFGAPNGGYDIFIDGVDQNNHLKGLTTTVSGLAPGEHTFQVEARYMNTRDFMRSNVVSAVLGDNAPPASEEPSAPEAPAVSDTTTTPVLEVVQVVGGDVVLTWSQPESVYGAPSGGYDTFIDGIDQNNHLKGLTSTISGLAPGEHTFQVEARYMQTREFNRSNVVTAVVPESTPAPAPEEPAAPEEPSAPEAPAVSDSTTTPVLESVQVVGSDFVLTWSQPESVYGAPDGGYDIFIDGVDQNNHLEGLTTTISGLTPGEHTFQVEARYMQTREFNRSNVVSAVLEASAPPASQEPPAPEEPSAPEAPAVSETTTTPVLEAVQVNGSDVVLAWSQPASVYGAPDGGYDIFINGVDQNNHLNGHSTTISGLAPGEHTFQVEARYMQTREFNRSNVMSAVLADNAPPAPPAEPEEPAAPEVPQTTTTPALESAEVVGNEVVLTWSQPESAYGAPDGGYDIFIDGVDQNNHLNGLSTTIGGLTPGTHTFQVEARYTETREFNRSNVLSVVIEGNAGTDPGYSEPPAVDPSLGYLPVFPGAQGFGTETKAGRGGKIIKVTNLNDSGSGSLRAAVAASGPRIIVFEVSGIIRLASDLKIKNPYITIAGQTAPSPGITLRGATLSVFTNDVLIQHLRVRVGDDSSGPSAGNRDGLVISGYKTNTYNVVLDHLSVSWAIDEGGSTPNAPHEITISNTILSEGLHDSIHPQGVHSKGFLVREKTKNFSMIGNLFAHNQERNPRITGDTKVVAINNVFYNGGKPYWFDVDLGSHGATGPHALSVVGNVFIEGPNTPHYAWPIQVDATCKSGTKIYQSDNVADGGMLKNKASFDPMTSSPPVWHKSFKPRAGQTVEDAVLAHAGARPADRDSVDTRLANEVRSRGGSIIDSTSEVGGWPKLAKNTRTFNIPPNPNGDDDGDGYTNIEEILHQMAAEVEGRNSL